MKVRWTENALADLQAVHAYIARRSPAIKWIQSRFPGEGAAGFSI